MTDKLIPVLLTSIYGAPAYFIAETVKFKAPKADWKINGVNLIAYDGYNGSYQSAPMEQLIGLEIRDKNLKLLYKFADSQIPYSNYARNATLMSPLTIEVPQIPVSDEFYVCFYSRAAIAIACELLNETRNSSFIYISEGNQLLPATLPTGETTRNPINWIMAVSGN